MNSAYNQFALDKQPRRVTQFVIGKQQYKSIDYFMVYSSDQQLFLHL